MLHVPVGANTFGLNTFSWGTTRPATTQGASVVPVTTDAYGTYVQLFSALTYSSRGIAICINSNAAAAAVRNSAIRIGIDEAGGTSYVEWIGGLLGGSAAPYNIGGAGMWYYFPFYIPAGASVGVSARGTVATAFRVGAWLQQLPANAAMSRRGAFVETFGVTLGAATATGTTVTSGTTAEGAWTLLGTTTKRCWWWQVMVQLGTGDTNVGANALHVDLGVGNGTVAGTDVIIQDYPVMTNAAEQFSAGLNTSGCEYDVPAGSSIYARLQNSGTNDIYQVAAYGLGG
jgi:hypothetical protein